MTTDVYIASDSSLTPLGFSTDENYLSLRAGMRGMRPTQLASIDDTLYIARLDDTLLDQHFAPLADVHAYTKAEKLLLLSIYQTLQQAGLDSHHPELQIIISTTKGNIDLLGHTPDALPHPESHYLWHLADTAQKFFQTTHRPLILSNACISGVNALVTATRLIKSGMYRHVVVAGVDLASDFVISGFHSFKAISTQPCRPFDQDRTGINLGEGCGSLLLTSDRIPYDSRHLIRIAGGATSNDANHISGPSRTGDGLFLAIDHALQQAALTATQIDYLNAHGTATLYNDEMEAKAFHLAGLQNTPMNGWKGYLGHTLGAAGTLESIFSIRSMCHNEILPTLGYAKPGTSESIQVSDQKQEKEIRYLLKTASGFGGCNGAVVFEKIFH
jgi:3-oxoacyl-[acyl-carrier-protein] synthase-1